MPNEAKAPWFDWIVATEPEPPWLQFAPAVWVLLVLSLLIAFMLRYSLHGRYLYAIGSNEATARLCGLNVPRLKIIVYGLAGLLTGLAGVIQFMVLGGTGDPTTADGLELQAIAAPLFHGSVADIGSGAGLRGLVLAIARPDVSWTLVEPMERRINWLAEQVNDLELTNVTILRARAEDVRAKGAFDVVTARAVSALRTLIPLTAPLVRDGGELALLKGMNAANEIEAARKQIAKFKLADVRVEVLGEGLLPETTRVVRASVR